MTLLLDIGNTRIKQARLHGGELLPLPPAAYSREGIAAWCAENLSAAASPQSVWVANVAGETVAADLTRWCQDNWQLTPVFVQTERVAGGIRNGYENAAELGVDRWLSLIAARQRYSGAVCVISVGTALTVDAVTASGEHLGGLILPGLELMQQALRQATHAVQIEAKLPVTLTLARSTEAGVAAGSGYAIAGLIERVLEQLGNHGNADWQALITGGGATAVAPLCRPPLQIEKQLVLEGLAWYAGQSS